MDRSVSAPNGEPVDLTDPATAAGVLARVDSDVQVLRVEQARQGRMLDRIAKALGIEPDKSEPPPDFRGRLDSLEQIDAETSQSLKAITADVAQTKLIVRVGLIEGVPKLVKVVGGLVAVLSVLAVLAQQIWMAVHGH